MSEGEAKIIELLGQINNQLSGIWKDVSWFVGRERMRVNRSSNRSIRY